MRRAAFGPGEDAEAKLRGAEAADLDLVAELNRQLAILAARSPRRSPPTLTPGSSAASPALAWCWRGVGARPLGEFGDDPDRYRNHARRRYAGTAPITKASGTKKVVLTRFVRNRHLADACYPWAFCALTHSPGARAFYDAHRARGNSHAKALRALANKLVGILDGCLRSRSLYNEASAWRNQDTKEAA